MAKPSAKGSNFERNICKILSLWWTDGKRDDVFWRSQASGARATTRSKLGKDTMGQHGDIQATDPIGFPLTRACSIELKNGYGKWSFLDVLDRPAGGAQQQFEKFLQQAIASTEAEGSDYPVLICKRDRRTTIVVFPRSLYEEMVDWSGHPKKIEFSVVLRWNAELVKEHFEYSDFIAMRLNDFFDWASPDFFHEYYTVEE